MDWEGIKVVGLLDYFLLHKLRSLKVIGIHDLCGLKGQWSTQPRASEATPWVSPCRSSRALKGQKH